MVDLGPISAAAPIAVVHRSGKDDAKRQGRRSGRDGRREQAEESGPAVDAPDEDMRKGRIVDEHA